MNDKQHEKIKVWILYKNGKTACMCMRSCRKCDCKDCEPDIVLRDKHRGWQQCFRQNKYGH